MKININKGILLALEGIDGSGKSSIAKILYEHFSKSYECIITKEPGGSNLGKKLRDIVQHEKVTPIAEYLLFASDRAQHFVDIIIPALKANKIIISDRMADSSIVYQGYTKGLDIELIKKINNWTMQNIEPDLVLYIKVDPKIARSRILARKLELTQFEKEKEEFMIKVSESYDQLFASRKNVITIDGNGKLEDVALNVIKEVEQWIKTRHL